MLGWALTFLIVALIAAVLGFGGIAGFAVEIAKIIFFVAIVLFSRRRKSTSFTTVGASGSRLALSRYAIALPSGRTIGRRG